MKLIEFFQTVASFPVPTSPSSSFDELLSFIIAIAPKVLSLSYRVTLFRFPNYYSAVPNKRTYLNKHTYQNFFQKTITIPTQITVPTRKPLYLLM